MSAFPRPHRAGLAAAVAAGAFFVAGCGSGSPSDGGAQTPEKAPAGTHVSERDFSSARDAYDLKVARCLRGKGFDVKDPQPGKGIQESSPEIDAAGSDCMHEIGDPPAVQLTKAQEAKRQQTALEEAACLRAKGYDVQDPTADSALAVPPDAKDADVDACLAP
ncbi:hypothetical protein [Patulibacter sp. SYSU D01012]|uniref:hypothetical protein n=1 Tax=Patulibacter sp. SYSU D01012 TaxID=2817381 RepID=UPI001B305FA5|nr:hypothetical protein [Patulibacter sp. SYSU D01012]